MQVTETVAQGLKRELKVVVGKDELAQKFNTRLESFKSEVQLKGFRKGKVPTAHIKKLYGRSLMGEVLQETLDETSRKAISDRNERPAMQPKVDIPEDQNAIAAVIDGKDDLAYTMSFEVLPDIKLGDLSTLKLERETAKVDAADVDRGVEEIVTRATQHEDEEGRAAADGDRVTIDFVGRIDGVEFAGGKGEAMPVVLGRGGFIPGFEEGLIGAKAGETRTIKATFPEGYPEASLAGKTAEFETTVKAVGKPVKPAVDDEFAKSLGVESVAKLREAIEAQISAQYAQLSRLKLKRQILDQLDATHSFELPQSLVDNEFEGIWQQANAQLAQAGKTFADEGKTEEGAREEYRKIAERRVRLGLVIGEIGDKQKIQVTQDELRGALIEEARRYPGQEKFVYEYYQKNPQALTGLRAPIFEEKVVDYIVDLVKPAEKTVSREELLKAGQEGEDPV
ncbi:MAG TPA: trigger factor [Hyphomicrobiaceae bacterium]|nr:trigger factor [Hyphomicrobiaceae bacterium]